MGLDSCSRLIFWSKYMKIIFVHDTDIPVLDSMIMWFDVEDWILFPNRSFFLSLPSA